MLKFFVSFSIVLVSLYLVAERFTNTNGIANEKSFSDFLKWSLSNESPERIAIESSEAWKELDLQSDNYILWIGHASFLINIGGTTILTDTVISKRASPLRILGPKRLIPPALTLKDLPKIDLVTISHNHYDHLDVHSLKQIYKNNPTANFLVPKGDKKILTKRGIENVFEFLWWENFASKNLVLTFTPVQHWSARGLGDRNKSLWGGWFFKFEDYSIYHAGDTGYSNDFKDTKSKLGSPKYAFIPIGAYDPEWFMAESHVNPEDAVQIMLDLDAENSFGMHWATFKLTDEDTLEPKERLDKAISNINMDNFIAPSPGSVINLD